jgi:hypothetical protein
MEMFFIKVSLVLFLSILLLIENIKKKWNKGKSQPKKVKQDFAFMGDFRLFPWPLVNLD